MNILFLTITKIRDPEQHSLYADLMREFARNGHQIYIYSPVERKEKMELESIDKNGLHLRFVPIHDYYNTSFIKKGISSLSLSNRYYKSITTIDAGVKFDLILYATPPITFQKVIENIKRRDECKTYLMLKDIWPQGMLDLGLISNIGIKGLIYKQFKKQEESIYRISDYIGCMSEGNCEYLLAHNPFLTRDRVEVCPNAVEITKESMNISKNEIRAKYNIPEDKIVFVYGGNLGKPQGIPFLLECLKAVEKTDYYILIVGKGTEYKLLENWIIEEQPKNCTLYSFMPKEDYLSIVQACDVGLIFLNHDFTVPNIPSRILSYMEMGIPVLASTDPSTDLKKIINDANMGYWCESNNVDDFLAVMERFNNKDDRVVMGKNGKEYLTKKFSTAVSYKIIMRHFL